MSNVIENSRKDPFVNMRIDDSSILGTIEGRQPCDKCNRSRKFFCYNCCIPVGNLGEFLPKVEIPVRIDIIKHKKEIDGKSTAVHAALLAANHCKIYTYPDIPDYSTQEGVVLIYPCSKSGSVGQLFNWKVRLKTENNYGLPKGYNIGTLLKQRVPEIIDEDSCVIDARTNPHQYDFSNLPIKRAVLIDSTWNQSRGIYKDERISALKPIVLQNRCSQFWRHQRGSPRWYLATIEAIHQFLLEVHVNAWGINCNYRGLDNLEISKTFFMCANFVDHPADDIAQTAPYNGQYDNLMYFFANMYVLIHNYYDHNELKSYKRPI